MCGIKYDHIYSHFLPVNPCVLPNIHLCQLISKTVILREINSSVGLSFLLIVEHDTALLFYLIESLFLLIKIILDNC